MKETLGMYNIRLLIIEDNRLLRESFVEMLQYRTDIEVKAETGQKEELEQAINLFKPHVILLNFGLDSQNSLMVVEKVSKKYPDAKILVMHLAPIREEILQFIDAGATGFILKEASTQDFIRTIKTVAKGEIVLPMHYADILLPNIVSHAIVKKEIDHRKSVQITKIELQLLQLLYEGLSNIEIGEKLGISTERVTSHIHNIRQNLYLFSLLDPIE